MRVRHQDTRKKATVRFCGEIPVTLRNESSLQQFYGIEYDVLGTGKYNGTYQDIQYFECPENTGAFVKDKKLLFSTSLYDAIQTKYITDRKAEKIMTLTDGQLTKEIEFCGIEQVDKWHKQIGKMQSIGFPDNCVQKIDNFVQLNNLIKECKSLDLSDNLINDVNSVMLLFKHLEHIIEINISDNFNIQPSKMDKEIILQLQQVEKQNCSLILNNISLQNNQKLNEDDLNMLRSLKLISQVQMNNSVIDINKVIANDNLVSLSLTQSCKFEKLQDLIQFLKYFKNLQEFTACDTLNENMQTVNQITSTGSSKITYLNLQESSLQYDSLQLLKQFCPNIQYLKVLKIFHSQAYGQKSIFQSDQVIPLLAGLFYETIKQVNSYEIKQKHLSDYQLFYVKYMCQILGKQKKYLSEEQLLLLIQLRVPMAKQLLPQQLIQDYQEQLNKLELLIHEDGIIQQHTKSESQIIQEKYKERLMVIKHLQSKEELLITKSTPIWKLIEIVKQKFNDYIDNKRILLQFDGNRTIDLQQVRFSSLLEEFREFYCTVDFQ